MKEYKDRIDWELVWLQIKIIGGVIYIIILTWLIFSLLYKFYKIFEL
jgi:hypothetical protein